MSHFGGPRRHKEPVILNVYDLSPMNQHLYSLGLGAYHSGLEVHGTEYSFGGGPEGAPAVGTGVFTCAPREAAGATFRESIVVGETGMLSSEVANLVRTMESEWQASDYNVMTNNCNCFTSALCLRLTGKPSPPWINRLASVGKYFDCLIPKGQQRATPSGQAPTPQRQVFSGTGYSLAAPSSSVPQASASAGLFNRAAQATVSSSSSVTSADRSTRGRLSEDGAEPSLEERRRLMAAAAARRFGTNNE